MEIKINKREDSTHFNQLLIGSVFVWSDKLLVKVSDNSALVFGAKFSTAFHENTSVLIPKTIEVTL